MRENSILDWVWHEGVILLFQSYVCETISPTNVYEVISHGGLTKRFCIFVCQEIEYNYWVWHCPAHKSINNKRGHKGKNNVVPICTSRNVNTLSSAQSDGWGETQQSFGRHTVSDLTSGAIITHKSLSARHGNGSEFTTFFFPFAGEFSFFFPTHTLYYIFQTASLSLQIYKRAAHVSCYRIQKGRIN